MKHFIFATLLFLVSAQFGARAQSIIFLNQESDGRYTMNASVNGVGVKTYYAPESWFASLSSTTYLFLYENGYIADEDVKGITTIKMPDGSTTKGASCVIKNLRIDNIIVQNLPAFVITKQTVPLLVGNSAFDCFGEVTQEGRRLIVNDAEDVIEPSAEDVLDPVDQLKLDVQSYLDSKDYASAAKCFEELYRQDELNMYNEYQYAMVLNILSRNDECINFTNRWLEANKGRSLILDYWMYDALGDCYAKKRDAKCAVEYYEQAVETYCSLFNTTLKDIKKSKFKDETLGYTLYDLGRQYASINIGKTEYYVSLAAKSGNAAAIDFCEQAKIRY